MCFGHNELAFTFCSDSQRFYQAETKLGPLRLIWINVEILSSAPVLVVSQGLVLAIKKNCNLFTFDITHSLPIQTIHSSLFTL